MKISSAKSLFFKAAQLGELQVYRNGKLYANRPFVKGLFKFNIPFSGNYEFSGKFFELHKVEPLQKWDKIITLPDRERNKTVGIKKIVIKPDMDSPARIYTDDQVILVSDKWLAYPVEMRFFILLHEVGHFYYQEEWKCDTFAAHWFIKLGFNPSQAFESLAGVLCDSDTNDERINNIYNLLKN